MPGVKLLVYPEVWEKNVRCDGSAYTGETNWRGILGPYKNLAPSSLWNELVLYNLTRKVNDVDPRNMLTPLLGLLREMDKADQCRLLLELGADADARYLLNEAGIPLPDNNAPLLDIMVGATAVHVAAYLGRRQCLLALIDAGIDVGAKTKLGMTALDLVDGSKKEKLIQEFKPILVQAAAKGPKNLAELAKEGLFFALRYRMRNNKIDRGDFFAMCDGKTALEWLTAIGFGNHTIPEDAEAPFVALQIVAELRLRYNLQASICVMPPTSSNCGLGASVSEAEERVKMQGMILEGISALFANSKNNVE